MSAAVTEARCKASEGIDMLDSTQILKILLDGQVRAANSVAAAIEPLCQGAMAMANAVRSGHKLVYAAAGSSGLQAMADGLEITPTFGVPLSQVRLLRAGGLEGLSCPKGSVEDDSGIAADDASIIEANDCVICLAASGSTVYPVTVMHAARERGAVTIGISNNPDTVLLTDSDIPVFLPTPPEVIAGSTRLGAGTAQKIALNMMSSLMGIHLGHVMDGLMVNVTANNNKLVRRAESIVMDIVGCSREVAAEKLGITDGTVKEAVVLAKGVGSRNEARRRLERADGNLRRALDALARECAGGVDARHQQSSGKE